MSKVGKALRKANKKTKNSLKTAYKGHTEGFKQLAKGNTKEGIASLIAGGQATASLPLTAGVLPLDPFEKYAHGLMGMVETSPGKFTSKKDIAKDKNAFDLSLNVARVNAEAELAASEEEKRRRRRNNIITKPLGALASQASLTRVLTGQ